MLSLFGEPSRRQFISKTAAPLLAAAVLLNLIVFALFYWSTSRVDEIAIDRQRTLVELVVSRLQTTVAHDQESVTVWDDAVNAVRNVDAAEWIDLNLGSWMNTYFGHDGAFVIKPDNELVYASSNGIVADRVAFAPVWEETAPLVAELRSRLISGDLSGVSDRVLTPGAGDLVVVSGRPAVASVKPIVSDSGDIEQVPGREYLHIAIRYLDDSLVSELTRDYLFDGLRFSATNETSLGEVASALQSANGDTVGYFMWTPYRPGSTVFSDVFPVLVVLFVVGMVAMGLLLAGIRRRSLSLRRSEAEIRHLATHDLLTGLPNRGQFNERLNDTLMKARDTGEKVALLYLDLDRFKEVNDTLGHSAGDELLREFSDRLRRLTREIDIVARLGGDEFTILVHQLADDDEVKHLCQRLIESARHPFDIAGTQVFVGVSAGVAVAPRDGLGRVELMRRADVALYRAKAAGRSEFAIFNAEMDVLITERRDLERDLRKALDAPGQLEVHYQPLFAARGQRLSGVEALLRWNHPQLGKVSPEIFIPVAEETGLIEKIGEFVLREACTAAVEWAIDLIAVNVSAIELRNPTYAVRVTNILMSTGLNPRRLELEVTETALGDKGGECAHNVAALRELGVSFALDDFGTGFSSLGRLQQLDVDRIKIDRSFVQGFGSQNGDEAIVQAIVDLARATGLKTTAEGVETVEQREFLDRIGCDELQGFLLAKPMPAAEFEQCWLGRAPSRVAPGGARNK